MRIREANPSDAGAIAKVHVDTWRTTYKGIVPDDFLAGLSYEKRTTSWTELLASTTGSRFIYVAEDVIQEIIGFASGGPERTGDATYRGELYGIYILQPFQRRGVGRMLITAVSKALVAHGLESMLVWVLAKNEACTFYEAMGGKRVNEMDIAIGGLKLVKVAYGWENLRIIAGENI